MGLCKHRQKRAKKDITAAIVAGEVVYGIREGIYFIVHKLDVKGRPSPTTKALLVRPEEDRATTKWGQGIAGISESFSPWCPVEFVPVAG